MKIQTTLKLLSVNRLLMQSMEILNSIPENEYLEIVRTAKAQKVEVTNVKFSCELGNLFMTIFRVREWIERIINQSA